MCIRDATSSCHALRESLTGDGGGPQTGINLGRIPLPSAEVHGHPPVRIN